MKRPNLTSFLFVLAVLVLLFIVSLVIGLIMNPQAITAGILTSRTNALAPALILAIGMALVVVYHGIDFSMGATVSLSAVLCVLIANSSGSIWMALPAVVGVSLLIGVINGAAVGWLRMPAFITTLATWGCADHLALLLTRGRTVGFSDPALPLQWGERGIPGMLLLVIALLLPVILYALARVLAFQGRASTGGTFMAYVFAAYCGGIAALVLVSQNAPVSHDLGTGRQWMAIAAVIMGGAFLYRGPHAVLMAFGTTALAVFVMAWIRGLGEALNFSAMQLVGMEFLPPILCGLVYALAAQVLFNTNGKQT